MKGNFDKIISGNKPILVDFYATWCGPCKAVPPILKQVKSDLQDAVKIVKVDIDRNRYIADRYKVQAVPTLILFKNGRIVWRQSGVQPANAIIKVIKNAV
ncbi:MAG: thioredoxin [Bacteroidetes bacterium]|nr:thioredoxin [Bacteroidota bacterium]